MYIVHSIDSWGFCCTGVDVWWSCIVPVVVLVIFKWWYGSSRSMIVVAVPEVHWRHDNFEFFISLRVHGWFTPTWAVANYRLVCKSRIEKPVGESPLCCILHTAPYTYLKLELNIYEAQVVYVSWVSCGLYYIMLYYNIIYNINIYICKCSHLRRWLLRWFIHHPLITRCFN